MKIDITNVAKLKKNLTIVNGTKPPLKYFVIDNSFILAVYQGKKSDLDIVIKYRQLRENSTDDWSHIRTPSHTHWMVDMLVKRIIDMNLQQSFTNILLSIWENEIIPFTDYTVRSTKIDQIENLYNTHIDTNTLAGIVNQGFYPLKFLFYVAVLLMYQEKTNYPNGVLFQGLLAKLASDTNDLFSIFQSIPW